MFQNWHKKFDEFWLDHSKVYTLMDCFWTKFMMSELKKYRGVIFYYTRKWCKMWRKTDLWFGKEHEKFAKFLPEDLKISKLGLWWGTVIQSRNYMSLNLTGELFVMTMKNDPKFEKELTCQFKIDIEI